MRRHAVPRLYLHRDVLIGRDAVGVSQLQHRGNSWVVGARTHHPAAVVEGLTAAGGNDVTFTSSSYGLIHSIMV